MAREAPTSFPASAAPSVVSIHFPGVLRDAKNPSNALAALGGEHAVTTTVVSVSRLNENNPISKGGNIGASASASRFAERRRLLSVPPLNLSLRPGDGSSASNIESSDPRAVARQFIIRVSTSSSKRTEDKSHSISETQVLGRLSHILAFPGISDWQFLSDTSLAAANRRFHSKVPGLGDEYSDAPDRIPTKSTHKLCFNESSWRPPSIHEMRTQRAMNIISLISLGKCAPPSTTAPSSTADNTDAAAGAAEAPVDSVPPCDFREQSEVLDLCRPWRFSRTGAEFVHHSYLFQQHSYGRSNSSSAPFVLGCDRRSDALRLVSKPWKVPSDSAEIPMRPPSPNSLRVFDENGRAIIPRRMRNRELLQEKLQTAFRECPVWLRRSVLQRVRPELRSSFVNTIRMVAYSFYSAGPFAQAWVRYGFDPRQDREARQYQVVDLRINNPVSVAAIKLQFARKKAHIPKHERIYAWTADHSLSDVPTYRHLFLQLRDLEIPEVKSLLEEEAFPEKYNAKVGFFTDEGYTRVLKAIRKRIYEMSFEMLGQDRTRQIMDEFRQERRLRKSKRKRKNFFSQNGSTAKRTFPRTLPNSVTVNAAGHVSVYKKQRGDPKSSRSEEITEAENNSDDRTDEKDAGDGDAGADVVTAAETGESEGAGGISNYDETLLNFEDVEAFEVVGDDDDDDDEDDDEDEDMEDYDDGEMDDGDGSDEM